MVEDDILASRVHHTSGMHDVSSQIHHDFLVSLDVSFNALWGQIIDVLATHFMPGKDHFSWLATSIYHQLLLLLPLSLHLLLPRPLVVLYLLFFSSSRLIDIDAQVSW